MEKGETVHVFCERFDEIVRQYELFDETSKLSDVEKRSVFKQSSQDAMPDVCKTDTSAFVLNGKE